MISMAPDGALSVQFDGNEEVLLPDTNLEIDRLVERSLTPAMLEDEINVKQMLQTLRSRLANSLDLVDAAIAHLNGR